MDVEQVIFKKLFDFFKKKNTLSQNELDRKVCLEDIQSRLSIIARALTGESIEITHSEREGGWKDLVYFLAKEMYLFPKVEQNVNYYLFRVFYLSIQQRLNLNWQPNQIKDVETSQEEAEKNASQVLHTLFEEFPGLESIHQDLVTHFPETTNEKGEKTKDFSWLYGRYFKNSAAYAKKQLEKVNTNILAQNKNDITTEIESKSADELEVLQVDKEQQEQYVMTHNFEKVDTIDEFSGNWRDFDGDDDLKNDEEALAEHNLKHVVRVDDPVHSVYKAQFKGNTHIAESADKRIEDYYITYPEWDFSKREYKANFCKVFPKRVLKDTAFYYTKTIANNKSTLLKLKKKFALLNNDFETIKRQTDGESVDIDSLTDFYADIKSKRTPNENIYLRRKKAKKEISLLILLDLSLSADGYTKGNRIIDVEKQVSILFGEVLNEYEINFQIDGFYSKTRNNTSYISLKRFEDTWDNTKNKIGSIQPQGYTRIGPAIRHAKSILNKQTTKKKWLILLSDGKPNDYDKYEGKYGIQDIKQALRETKADGIENFALAIEEQAKYYLPQMFGKNHYNILSSPLEMVFALSKLYRRIAKS